MIMLAAEGVSKDFTLHLRAGISFPVLRGETLTLRAGECVALVGPSGAGKSTLLRCLQGNYGADAGRIWVRHRGAMLDLAAADPRTVRAVREETLGYVSQFLRVIPRVSALEVVMEAGATRSHARELLSRLNLPERLHDLPPATFSGGEQQRVNLARGFARPRAILLLDEPTASLDAANRDVAVALIRERKAAGAAILGIFHDEAARDAVADRLHQVSPIPASPAIENA